MQDFSSISTVFKLSPRNGIYNEIRADFDPHLGRWRNESILTSWQKGKFSLSGTYFGIQAVEPGIPAGNHLEGRVVYGSPRNGILSSFSAAYNLRTNQILNSGGNIGYTWDCCGANLNFNQFDLGFRTETRFSFSFSLKGIGNFGNVIQPGGLF